MDQFWGLGSLLAVSWVAVGCSAGVSATLSAPGGVERSTEPRTTLSAPSLAMAAPAQVAVRPPAPEPRNPGPAASLKGPLKLVRGNPAEKKIALTFDDGPHRGYTEHLIEILKDFHVKATFFMIGRNVDACPDLAKQAAAAGIELADHTYSHFRLPSLAPTYVRAEIEKGAEAIERATGVRPRMVRPPGGEYDSTVETVVKELGMTMVLWTADAGDFTTVAGNPSGPTILKKVLRGVSPGGIVIMHDPMPGTLMVLPHIITSLRALGYEFVTVSEMAADPKCVTTGGPRIAPRDVSPVQPLVLPTRYPPSPTHKDQHADSEQGTAVTPPKEGRAGQGTRQRGEGSRQGR